MKRVQHTPILQSKTTRLVMCICLVVVTSFEAGCKAFGKDDAPPSPDKPWRPPQLDEYQNALARGHFSNERSGAPIEIDPKEVYDLPELIDIAERANPETRTAWERARQAAEAVGLAQSAYFPYLVASAGAGYEHAFLPFPTLKLGPGPTDV